MYIGLRHEILTEFHIILDKDFDFCVQRICDVNKKIGMSVGFVKNGNQVSV